MAIITGPVGAKKLEGTTTVIGPRPETIKVTQAVSVLRKCRLEASLIFTGRHYKYLLSNGNMEQLDLNKPDSTFASNSRMLASKRKLPRPLIRDSRAATG